MVTGVEAFAAETIQTNRTQHEFDSFYRIDYSQLCSAPCQLRSSSASCTDLQQSSKPTSSFTITFFTLSLTLADKFNERFYSMHVNSMFVKNLVKKLSKGNKNLLSRSQFSDKAAAMKISGKSQQNTVNLSSMQF